VGPGIRRGAPWWGALLLFWAPLAAAGQAVWVSLVVDGDTVQLSDARWVRLIGINSPERARDGRPAEPLAEAARQALAALLEGRPARLEPGIEPRDRHGRLLATLYAEDGTDVQAALLAAGLAAVVAVPPNLRHLADYLARERSARRARRGIWGHPYFAPRPAESVDRGGFQFVRGRVRRVGASRKYIYLDLARRFSLQVPRADWRRYFGGDPEDWLDRRLTARGWVARSRRGWRMRVRHPAMIEP